MHTKRLGHFDWLRYDDDLWTTIEQEIRPVIGGSKGRALLLLRLAAVHDVGVRVSPVVLVGQAC
jgi:hypothetical protein